MNKKVQNHGIIHKIVSLYKKIKTTFSSPVIAVIYMNGVIGGKKGLRGGGLSMESLLSSIEAAFNIPNVKAIALSINSPGGSPAQSEFIYKKIRLEMKKNPVPVLAFTEDVAASGGYYLACAANEIFALENSIIGSIGVISAGFGFKKSIEKLGIERRVYSEGKNKSILDPFLPEKAEDVELIKSIQKDIYHNFTGVVRDSRKGKLTLEEAELFSGKFWSGLTAKKHGLVDEIGDLYSVVYKRYGKKAKIKPILPKTSWFRKNFSSSNEDFLDLMISKVIGNIEDKTIWEKFNLHL